MTIKEEITIIRMKQLLVATGQALSFLVYSLREKEAVSDNYPLNKVMELQEKYLSALMELEKDENIQK